MTTGLAVCRATILTSGLTHSQERLHAAVQQYALASHAPWRRPAGGESWNGYKQSLNSALVHYQGNLRSQRCKGGQGSRSSLKWRCQAQKGGPGGERGSDLTPSQAAKMRSEVADPFRVVRIFLYGAFLASASIGGLIALTRVIAALAGGNQSEPLEETVRGLGIDVAAIALFAFLYRSESRAQQALTDRFAREEVLGSLRLELGNGKVVTLAQMRGFARVVIVAGPSEHCADALRNARMFIEPLLERGVLVVPVVTSGPALSMGGASSASSAVDESGPSYRPEFGFPNPPPPPAVPEGSGTVAVASNAAATTQDMELRFRASPLYTNQWIKWLEEQMKMANVKQGSPVYISLRLDGRVRGSGVGFPPWQRFVAQLAPLKGMWKGLFDGLDGRV